AAQLIRLDEADTVLAGGMENMSQAPHVIRGLRLGLTLGGGQMEELLMAALMDAYCGFYMANTAENLARELSITREQQDLYALRSQKAADAAYRAGKFAEEIVPVEVKSKKGKTLFAEDDHRRPESTLEILAALPTAFGKDGFVTAGNASGIVDGAAAGVGAAADAAGKAGGRPLGRIVTWAVVGVEPRIMGIGPVPAIRRVVEK